MSEKCFSTLVSVILTKKVKKNTIATSFSKSGRSLQEWAKMICTSLLLGKRGNFGRWTHPDINSESASHSPSAIKVIKVEFFML